MRYADPVAQKHIDELEKREVQTYQDGESSGYADWQCAIEEFTSAPSAQTPLEAVGYIQLLEAEIRRLVKKVDVLEEEALRTDDAPR